jgi:hypothetical protein
MPLRYMLHLLYMSCSNICIKQRSPLPPEVMGEIARAAWVDVALWDHAALYLALISTHPYLREIMPSLAWTYVFCRSRRDFALYLYLRFGSVLSESKRHVQHAEMQLSTRHILRRGFRRQVFVKYPKLSHDTLTAAFEAIENGELLLPTPMTAIYSSSPGTPHPLGAHPILSPAHADAITDLRLVNTYFDAAWHARHHVYRSLTRLTIVHVEGSPASSSLSGRPALRQVHTHSRHEWLGGGRAKPGPDATRRAAGVGGLVLAGIPSQVRCTGCGGWDKNSSSKI